MMTPAELTDEEARVFAALGRRWLHFFTVFILGYSRLTPRDGFHGEVCRRLERIERPQFHKYYRGAYKTTIGNIARQIWGAAKDPENYDHLLLVYELPLGKQIMRTVGVQITENALLRRLYPELRANKKDWSDLSRSLSCRSLEKTGPTFEMRTLGQSLAGRHRQAMTLDDPVNDENYVSRTVQDELKRKFDYSWPTLDTDELAILATPYTDYDLTAYIIKQLYPDELDVFMQPVRGRGWLDANGKVCLEDDEEYADPQAWDDERFERARRKIGDPYIFRSQYMLDTTRTDTLGFRVEWWQGKHLSEEQLAEIPQTLYMAYDPASGKSTTSKPAIAVASVDAEGTYYARFSKSYKSEAEAINALFLLFDIFGPLMVGLERFGHGGYGTWDLVQKEGRRRKKYLPLEAMTGVNQDERIRQVLRTLYEWGKVLHARSLKGSDYEGQLSAWPGGEFQDEPDAMSRAVILAQKYGHRPPREKRDRKARPLPGEPVGYTLEQMGEYRFPKEAKQGSW